MIDSLFEIFFNYLNHLSEKYWKIRNIFIHHSADKKILSRIKEQSSEIEKFYNWEKEYNW